MSFAAAFTFPLNLPHFLNAQGAPGYAGPPGAVPILLAMSFITLIGSAFRAGMLAAFLLLVGVAVAA
ncbi:MAG: hypothetical protein HYX53_14645 [Chloroflexi bacterium]|nr:hypothetical protein [Chloroflexota bacterium]